MPLEPSASTLLRAGLCDNIYCPLDKTKESIRLLSIDAESEDTMSCQLHVVENLKERPPFIAVSYTWGAESPTKAILVNGFEIEIRMNLHELLQQLLRDQRGQGTDYVCSYEPPARARNYEKLQEIRQSMQYPSRWEYFWIDALCINQASTEEKGNQVAMMGEIYSSASFVLAWLGPKADDSAIAMRVLDDMQIQGHTLLTLREEKQWAQLNALRKLFRRPYWTRMWVVQEFVLARELLLRSGDAGATVGSVSYYSETSLKPILRKQELRNFLSFTDLVHNKEVYKVKEQPILTDIILDFAERQCSDIRDKVFALLSLATLREYPAPDYSATLEQVFLGVIEEDFRWFSWSTYYGDGSYGSWVALCVQLASILGIDNETAKGYAKLVNESGAEEYMDIGGRPSNGGDDSVDKSPGLILIDDEV